MKIGILTYHRAHNYGAVLQAYALKTYLVSLGHEAEIVDYWPEYHEQKFRLFDWQTLREKRGINFVISLLKQIISYLRRKPKYTRFSFFIERYLDIQNKKPLYRNEAEILDLCELYIYGSDQIWRLEKETQAFDLVYFGEYPKTRAKKISYAASMGVIPQLVELNSLLMHQLNNFQSISVRERALELVIKNITKQPICQVLDPVFLLQRSQWELIAKNGSSKFVPKQNYLLFYHLNHSIEAIELAHKISRELNLRICVIGRTYPDAKRHMSAAGPLEFVKLFYNASFIVTTSFHGVAFSLLFRKQFFALGMANNSARATDLLTQAGIPNRYLCNTYEPEIGQPINYDDVESNLYTAIQHSKQFLNSELK